MSELKFPNSINVRFETKSTNNGFNLSGDLFTDINSKMEKKIWKKMNKIESIKKPLPKPIHVRAVRRVNFQEMSKHIEKYDSVVKNIRRANQLTFPADDDVQLKFQLNNHLPMENELTNTTSKKMANEIYSLINKSDNVETNEKVRLRLIRIEINFNFVL